jgi:hypothetical protein
VPADKTTADKTHQRGVGQKAEREALRNLTAAEATRAQKAMRDAELAKTKRLRALRLAKEADESKVVSLATKPNASGAAKRRSS